MKQYWLAIFLVCVAPSCLQNKATDKNAPLIVPSEKFLDVPMVRQSTTYSCGAAALQATLGYYGHEFTESEIMKEVGTDPRTGTIIDAMARFANHRDTEIHATIRSNLSLKDLQDQIQNKQLSIVDMQAWPDEEGEKDYTDSWHDGHYVVVIGIDERNVYLMDPSLLGSRGFLPHAEFMARWHEVNSKGEKAYQTAILFNGVPKTPPAWTKIP